ncbi:kinase-like domain-containing protein [Lenzites betulinus]|nr:kinase-like domain-containing protein [Lenzites betulinus]
MLRAARTADGRDVVIRVVCVGNEGQNHVNVLKHLARGRFSQATPNHTVPLFELIELEDITFAIFPRIGFSMAEIIFSDMQNSVGDFLDMIMQCLEALAFIHTMDVAHRDAFKDNFLIQWFPESLAEEQLTISRPRVFLNDFETAVLFDEGTPKDQQTCVGLPLVPTFAIPERYFRPYPKEVSSGEPYDPFKLDVWQFGTSLSDFKTTIPDIDTLLSSMTEEDPQKRPDAYTILSDLAQIVHSMPPDSLKIALVMS